jgi:hypothetical protein
VPPPNVGDAFRQLVAALVGISTFTPPVPAGPSLGSETTDAVRSAIGGDLEAIPQVRLRWYPPDVERAQLMATTGDLTLVGQLCESMNLDGVVRGLMDARTSVVNFPKRFYGSPDVTRVLLAKNASDRDVYSEMIPSTEARLMVGDGIKAGVAIGEMVPVVGRDFPVLVRRYPQNLYYLWAKNLWYYRSIAGLLPIRPGIPNEKGNMWVLHIPGGRLSPWNSGLWNTLGRSFVNKTQTIFARQSYEMKHSHPARVGTASLGASEADRNGLLTKMIRWALNTAFVLPVGYDLKLLESNGRGIDVYKESIQHYNEEIATALCGSAVMLQGTAGFTNMDVFRVVQTDLITSTSEGWDHTVNTQILPAFVGQRWGIDALKNATTVVTDTTAPKDRKVEADTLQSLANAIKGMVEAINAAQVAAGVAQPIALNLTELMARFGIPTAPTNVALALPAAGEGAGAATTGDTEAVPEPATNAEAAAQARARQLALPLAGD